jgi:hypothetical protein
MMMLNRLFVLLFICNGILAGCAGLGTPVQPKSDEVAVSKIGAKDEDRSAMKRQELEARIMRFGDRYAARMSLEADRIMDKATTPEMRAFATGWKLACQTAVVEIAVGPNAVENMLDMIVLASLTRQEVETYWVPEFLGEELGLGLLKASRQLDEDAWEGSKKVLTPEQQDDLRAVIHEWNEQHPDQHYFWGIRLAAFADQRAVELQQVQETGGLLGEVSQVRETAVEIREFGERVMYYMQRAPNLTRLQAEFGMREMLQSPEVTQTLDNTARITRSTERYADVLEKLPADMQAVITHMFNELEQEREAAIVQIADQQQEAIKALLISEELQTAVTNIGSEGAEITNTAFIRGVLLVLVWGVVFVIGRIIADKFRVRYQLKQQNIQ